MSHTSTRNLFLAALLLLLASAPIFAATCEGSCHCISLCFEECDGGGYLSTCGEFGICRDTCRASASSSDDAVASKAALDSTADVAKLLDRLAICQPDGTHGENAKTLPTAKLMPR
jgi:hypothetical protein